MREAHRSVKSKDPLHLRNADRPSRDSLVRIWLDLIIFRENLFLPPSEEQRAISSSKAE